MSARTIDVSGESYDSVYSVIDALAWKSKVKCAAPANVNLNTPGVLIDALQMYAGDRVLLFNQTNPAENGIYNWFADSSPLLRSSDADSAKELEQAIVAVKEGTFAGRVFQQTAINFVLGTGAVNFSHFRPTPRAASIASGLSLTPDAALDLYAITALAANATINAPAGTPIEGQKLTIRIKDNGTGRTLTWNAIYRNCGASVPTTTTANKTVYVGFIYNSADSKWDCVAVSKEV